MSDSASLPPKAAALLVKTLAAHTIFKEAQLRFEDLFDELLSPAGFSQPAAIELVQSAQKVLALAAYNDYSDKDFASAIDKFPALSALKEALRAWWSGDAKDAVRAHIIASNARRLERPTLQGLSWRVNNAKASSVASSGADPASGAIPDGAPGSASLTLELLINDNHNSTAACRTVSTRVTKEQLVDLVAQVEAARREAERRLAGGAAAAASAAAGGGGAAPDS